MEFCNTNKNKYCTQRLWGEKKKQIATSLKFVIYYYPYAARMEHTYKYVHCDMYAIYIIYEHHMRSYSVITNRDPANRAPAPRRLIHFFLFLLYSFAVWLVCFTLFSSFIRPGIKKFRLKDFSFKVLNGERLWGDRRNENEVYKKIREAERETEKKLFKQEKNLEEWSGARFADIWKVMSLRIDAANMQRKNQRLKERERKIFNGFREKTWRGGRTWTRFGKSRRSSKGST